MSSIFTKFAPHIAAAVAPVATYSAYNFYSGRVSSSGHHYNMSRCIGKVSEIGSAQEYMQRMQSQPNGNFPMPAAQGVGNKGEILTLYPFFVGCGNPVKVVDTSETSMLLEAMPGHTFQGTALHHSFERNGYVYHGVVGDGVAGEPYWKQTANVLFSDIGWPALMPTEAKREALKKMADTDPFSQG